MKRIILTSLLLLFSISLVACNNKENKLDKKTKKIVEDVDKLLLKNDSDKDEELDRIKVNKYENAIGAFLMNVDANFELITEEDFDNEDKVDEYKRKAVTLLSNIRREIVIEYEYKNPDLAAYYIAGFQCFEQIAREEYTYDIISEIKTALENSEDKESVYLELIDKEGPYETYIWALDAWLGRE